MKGVTLCVTSYSGESADSLCSTSPRELAPVEDRGISPDVLLFSLIEGASQKVYGSFMDPELAGVGRGVEEHLQGSPPPHL